MRKTAVKEILKNLRANHSKSNKFERKDEAAEQKLNYEPNLEADR